MRRTIAVMFTDVAGFTSFMEQNEKDAIAMLEEINTSITALLDSHSGSLVKEMGDGTLSYFLKGRSAINCARKIQKSLSDRNFQLRIGIHWGSVMLRDNDILGDTVNVASRLEKMAPPGGICVSSELLQNLGAGRKPDTFPLGLQKLKGLGRLINLFHVKGSFREPLPISAKTGGKPENIVTPSKREAVPSIAVMPLQNLGSSEDDFYAFGITSDLVSTLAAAGGIAVTPLTDLMKLMKSHSSSREIADKLKVRFILKGSLWKKDELFQLSIELHDLKEKKLIWVDNWAENWLELSSIKAKLSDGLLKVLGANPALSAAISDDSSAESRAYEMYLQASDSFYNRKCLEDIDKAKELLDKALLLQPDLVNAELLHGVICTYTGDLQKAMLKLTHAYEMALENGERAGCIQTLNSIGITQGRLSEFKKAKASFLRAMMLARTVGDLTSEAKALSNIGLMECNMGNYASALEHMEKSLDVPGVDSMGFLKANTLCNIGLTHWFMGENASALDFYRKSLSIYENLKDFSGQASLNMNIGIVTRKMGLFQDSLAYTEKALELNQLIGDRMGQSRTLVGIGNIHKYTGFYEKALACYAEAMEVAGEVGDRLNSSIIKTNIGVIHEANKDFEKALYYYNDALAISKEISDREGEGEILALMGNTLRLKGEVNKADELLRASIQVFNEIGAEARTVQPRGALAALLLHSSGSDGEIEFFQQIKIIEQYITPGMNDITEILFSISNLYSEYSELHSKEEKSLAKSIVFLGDAFDSVMREADNIHDLILRESFLSIDLHRDILEAYNLQRQKEQ